MVPNFTDQAIAEGAKASLNNIENISGKEMTTEEFVEHIKTVEVSGNLGQYSRENFQKMETKLFSLISKATTNGRIKDPNDFSKSYRVMNETFMRGGDHVQASMAMFEQLRKDGHEIDPEKKKEIIELVKNYQLQRENAQLYENWQGFSQHGDVDQFAKLVMGKNVPKVEGGKTDAATVTAFNENQDTASAATQELNSMLKDLRKGARDESGPVELDASVLMGMLAQMASQIMAYQASGHVNEVVIKEMVSTYNITAERTNKLDLEFDTSKVKQLSRVRKFEADGENPGKFKLEESRDI